MPNCDWGNNDCHCRDCREMEEIRTTTITETITIEGDKITKNIIKKKIQTQTTNRMVSK